MQHRTDQLWELWSLIDTLTAHASAEAVQPFMQEPEGGGKRPLQVLLDAWSSLFCRTYTFDRHTGKGSKPSINVYIHMWQCHLVKWLVDMNEVTFRPMSQQVSLATTAVTAVSASLPSVTHLCAPAIPLPLPGLRGHEQDSVAPNRRSYHSGRM